MFKLFTQENCPNCEELKTYMKQNNIEFTEADINTDYAAKAKLILADINSTPAFEYMDEIFEGSIEKLNSVLRIY